MSNGVVGLNLNNLPTDLGRIFYLPMKTKAIAPIIDPEFSAFFPRLAKDEREMLYRKIRIEGMTEPLIVWGDPDTPDHSPNLLLDGHNRLEICREYKIGYTCRYIQFEDREAALRWIALNQLARRNITAETRAYLIGKYYREKVYSKGERAEPGEGPHNDAAAEAAKDLNVSRRTINRHAKFATAVDALPAEEKKKVLEGQSSIQKVLAEETIWRDRPIKDALPDLMRGLYIKFERNRCRSCGELRDALVNKSIPTKILEEKGIEERTQNTLLYKLNVWIDRVKAEAKAAGEKKTPKQTPPPNGKPAIDWKRWHELYGGLARAIDNFFAAHRDPVQPDKWRDRQNELHDLFGRANNEFREAYRQVTGEDPPER